MNLRRRIFACVGRDCRNIKMILRNPEQRKNKEH
jgi:hypothetical protein